MSSSGSAPFGVTTSVHIPVNVTATVALPAVTGGSYRFAGGTADYVGIQDGRAVWTVGSGHVTFVAQKVH